MFSVKTFLVGALTDRGISAGTGIFLVSSRFFGSASVGLYGLSPVIPMEDWWLVIFCFCIFSLKLPPKPQNIGYNFLISYFGVLYR